MIPRHWWKIAAALLVLVVAQPVRAQTCAAGLTGTIPRDSASLSWTAPTQFTDNTPIPAAATITFKIYERIGATDTLRCQTTALTASFASLSVGTHSWVATATVGLESAKTAPVSKDIVAPTPGLPGNLTVQ